MLTRRIIPCLDVAGGRVVKGVRFAGLRDAGDPVELARAYADHGADELVFLDITATRDDEPTAARLAESVARAVPIPFTVGVGLRSIDDMRRVLDAGADKIAINSVVVSRTAGSRYDPRPIRRATWCSTRTRARCPPSSRPTTAGC